jgi:hypothetical protein
MPSQGQRVERQWTDYREDRSPGAPVAPGENLPVAPAAGHFSTGRHDAEQRRATPAAAVQGRARREPESWHQAGRVCIMDQPGECAGSMVRLPPAP